MPTYHYYKEGYDIPYDNFGFAVLRRHVDVPAIIASGALGYSPLAVAGVRTAIASTGFADGSVLELFRVPAGFLMLGGGVKVTTAGTAACTMDVGYATGGQTAVSVANASAANDDYFMAVADISAVGNFPFDGATGTLWSTEEPFTDLYVTNGSIDVTFETAVQLLLIADFWVYGAKCY